MKWIVLLCVLIFAPLAGAQTIFLPVQYQYGDQNKFYYGGSDPAVFQFARGLHEASWGRINGFSFYSGTCEHFREVVSEPLQAFSDQLPYENASLYGYNANDARNQANANVPTYFRKRDLVAAGVRQADGSLMVAAQARPITTLQAKPPTTTATVPILIIPKGQLLPPMKSNNIVIVKN